MITDELWSDLSPVVEATKRHKCGQRPAVPERMFLEGLLYWARTGIPWRDVPSDFGDWSAMYNRFRRWVSTGRLRRLFETFTANPVFGGVRRVLIDSTVIRAHMHASGARRRHKKIGAARSAAEQGLGRSRGGLTTKVVLTASDEDTALAVEVVPGQMSDAPRLEPMLVKTLARVEVIDELAGDKGFDGDEQRVACIKRGVFANIPNRKNRKAPWAFDAEGYRERNRVERLFGKMKQFRRVATRYEKLKQTFLGVIHLTLGFIKAKKRAKDLNVDTT